MTTINRSDYARAYGPTTNDQIRLADTELFIRVERDFHTYGEESTVSALGVSRINSGRFSGPDDNTPDMVLVNAVILDWWGVVKADIGIKDGRISAIGAAGSTEVQPNIDIVIGPATTVLDLAGMIVTPGTIALDVPANSAESFARLVEAGVTTLVGGGGSATGIGMAPPGASPNNIESIALAAEPFPLNLVISLAVNSSETQAPEDASNYGAGALRLNDLNGMTPGAIDAVLTVSEQFNMPMLMEPASGNESDSVEGILAATSNRPVVLLGVEGMEVGGPLYLELAGAPNIMPSTRISAIPYTHDTLPALLDPLLIYNDVKPIADPEAAGLAADTLNPGAARAVECLLDMGAISLLSGSHVIPEINTEIAKRAFMSAHKMKLQRGELFEDQGTNADNFRVRRWLSKYTINPAIACGISADVGSIEAGKLADLVVWRPAEFAVRPYQVFKSGDRSFSSEFGITANRSAMLWMTGAAVDKEAMNHLQLSSQIGAVLSTASKKDMKLNETMPYISVNSVTFEVHADGKLIAFEPAKEVKLNQLYSF